MVLELDDLDKAILTTLQNDARASFAELARKLGVSEGTIHLRVKKLRDKGVIEGFHARLSPSEVEKGLTTIVSIKAEPSLYSEVLKKLVEMEDVYEVFDMTGEFYAILKVRTKDIENLAEILDRIGNIEGVASTQTEVVLKTLKEQQEIVF
jgi:Lrp/AsnC family transcriptional regulator for asnA, asnC and gidA